MSYVLTCPNCGAREVTDFAYGGELTKRPRERPTLRELGTYNYFRRNVAGSSASGGTTGRAAGRGSSPSATPAPTTCNGRHCADEGPRRSP